MLHNPFQVNISFLYAMETSENLQFSNILREHKNGAWAWNEVLVLQLSFSTYDVSFIWKE